MSSINQTGWVMNNRYHACFVAAGLGGRLLSAALCFDYGSESCDQTTQFAVIVL